MPFCPYCQKELYYTNSGHYNCNNHYAVEVKFSIGYYTQTFMYVLIDNNKSYELIINHESNSSELGVFYKGTASPGFHKLLDLPSAVNVSPEQLVDRIKTWLTFS